MGRNRTTVLLLLLLYLCLCVGAVWAEERVHILERGETLYTLARRYNVDVGMIQAYNSIDDPTQLPIGARILIPGTYVVSEGEYIYSIARDLGVGWEDLLLLNGLSEDDVVRPGDILIVPSGAEGNLVSTNGASDTGAPSDDSQSMGENTASTRDDSGAGSSPAIDLEWPHPGVRELVEGKFPGMVMRGEAGDAFRSVTSGVVTFVAPYSSFGKLILIRGVNGFLYGYAGADRVDVEVGQRVEIGTLLGTLGFSPALQSTSMLFTVWKNNRYVDPETAPRG